MPVPDRDAPTRPRVALLVALGAVVLATAVGGAGRWGDSRWHGGGSAQPAAVPTVRAPTATTATLPPIKAPAGGSSLIGRIFEVLLWVLAIVVVTVIVVAIVRWWRARTGRAPRGELAAPQGIVGDEELDAAPDVQKVRRGFDRAFAVLDEDRPPSDAIVAAWMGLEEAAQDAGVVRRPAETPAELTRRILGLLEVDRAASEKLLDLYERVRFGGREASAQDVAAARACLETMTAGWRRTGPRAPVPARDVPSDAEDGDA